MSLSFPNKITREIFSSLVAINGWGSDKTQNERDEYTLQLFSNTKTALKHGIRIPLKISHDDKQEELHGYLHNVKLAMKATPTPHYVIIGKFFSNDNIFESYNSGKLPGSSVEIAPSANLMGYTGKNTVLTQNITGVALQGSTPEAMPHLQNIDENEGLELPYGAMFSRNVDPVEYKLNVKEKKMDGQKILEKIMEFLMNLKTTISSDETKKEDEEKIPKPGYEDKAELQAEEKKEEEKKEEEKKKEEDEKKSDELQRSNKKLAEKVEQMERTLIDKEYQLLAREGKVTAEEKDIFVKLALTSGLEMARSPYENRPPAFESGETLTQKSQSQTTQQNAEYREMLLGMGLSHEDADNHIKFARDGHLNG